MRRRRWLVSLALLLAWALPASAQVPPPPPGPPPAPPLVSPPAPPPPPPPQVEVIPAPRHGWYWVPGHWEWTGRAWAWEAGHWEKHRGRGCVWVESHWEGPLRWEPGHWVCKR